jgi:hypothetical protein
VNGFRCVNCSAVGFSGEFCEIPFDYCSAQQCNINNTVQCVNYQRDYKCLCKTGYTGLNCETNINKCSSQPCSSNSQCINEINSFRCLCSIGFSGLLCDISLDPCQRDDTNTNSSVNSSKCSGNGICYPKYFTNIGNIQNDYYCQCYDGYRGENCQETISLCSIYEPCLNNATCTDISMSDFVCKCSPGFTGLFCEQKQNPCDLAQYKYICGPGVCLNRPNGINDYSCLCPSTFTGIFRVFLI